MTNDRNTVLYTGVTNNLCRRLEEHRGGTVEGFTLRYNVKKLVYYETVEDIEVDILREKQIKAGSRKKKVELVEKLNPTWKDLSENLF